MTKQGTTRRWLALSMVLAFMILLGVALSPSTPANAQTGFNWQGIYYNTTNFTGVANGPFSYPAPLNLNFTGAPLQGDGISPVPGVGQDNWSAVFTAQVPVAQAGTYTFTGNLDDTLIVNINGVQVYADQEAGTSPISFTANLNAGTNTIELRFVEFSGQATLQFSFNFGGVPAGTAVPIGPTGQVVTVRGLSLRTGPYLGASFIAVLRPGILYPVSGLNNDESILFTWYRVTAGERVGWASGRYLTVNLVEEVPELTTVFQEIDDAPETGVTASPRAYMNLRRRPSTRSTIIGQIPWGATVPLLGRTVQAGENFWFHVRFGDQVGWIFAPFVSVNGPIEAVPIR